MKLTMLGTGNALVTACYNTCFLLDEQGELLLVDGGGGNHDQAEHRGAQHTEEDGAFALFFELGFKGLLARQLNRCVVLARLFHSYTIGIEESSISGFLIVGSESILGFSTAGSGFISGAAMAERGRGSFVATAESGRVI